MNTTEFSVYFYGSDIPEEVNAFTKEEAIILAQANRIKAGLVYDVRVVTAWSVAKQMWYQV